MSRWNLCVSLLSPTADGEGKCSEWHKAGVPGEARGKTREKMRENGGLWLKNGELLSGKFPMFASSFREVEEKSKRKPKKGAEEVKRYGRNAQFRATQRVECGGRTEKARRVGKTLAVRWRRNGKIILSLQHQNHFPPTNTDGTAQARMRSRHGATAQTAESLQSTLRHLGVRAQQTLSYDGEAAQPRPGSGRFSGVEAQCQPG